MSLTFKIALALSTLAIIQFCNGVQSQNQFPISSMEKLSKKTIESVLDRRGLQEETNIECLMCGNIGVPLIPDKVPYPHHFPNRTCGDFDNFSIDFLINDGIIPYESEDVVLPRCIHKRKYFETLCCDTSSLPPPYECQTNIYQNIIDSSYQKVVAPTSKWGEPVQVNVLFDIWGIDAVDILTSSFDLFVGAHLVWVDPRLAWNVSSENCATSITVDDEIWQPSLDLVNRQDGFQSFDYVMPTVYSDGTVYLTHFGKLSAFCSFIGVKQLPYDNIGCKLLFSHGSSELIKYNLVESGNDQPIGVNFPFYIQTYAEYGFKKELTKSAVAPFLLYDHEFAIELFVERRGKGFYQNIILLPTILFVIIVFGAFLFPAGSGERIDFTLNMLLIVVAQNIVTSEYLPRCKEKLWLTIVNEGLFFIVFSCVFQSLFMYWLMSSDENDIAMEDNIEGNRRNKWSINMSLVRKRMKKSLSKYSQIIDSVFAIGVPVTFVIFVITMQSQLQHMTDDEDKIWKEL